MSFFFYKMLYAQSGGIYLAYIIQSSKNKARLAYQSKEREKKLLQPLSQDYDLTQFNVAKTHAAHTSNRVVFINNLQ